ncbi:MAG: substrate-binding domain-containing protein [Bacteroidota bacterium]
MKKTIICFLSAFILMSGLWTFVLPQEKLRIAVVPKSNMAIFWKSVHAGANLGAVALGGVEVIWRAPIEEVTQQQISIIEQCIAEGVSGIVLAPLEKDSLAVPVAKAAKKKIPVLIFDSALKGTPGKDFISIAGIDNKKAGNIAGEQLAKLLGGKGKVVMLRVMASQSSIIIREEGFLETITKYKGIHLIEKNHYVIGTGTVDEAVNESMKIADKLRDADGVFCSYEQSTVGMLLTLRKLHLSGKVKFVGFDTPVPAVDALKNGEISVLIAQDPARMGFLSVKAIVDYIRGKKVPQMVDVPVQIITRENLNNPEIQKLFALPMMSE